MKVIETNGITYIELLAENSEWYCGSDFANGDLYEAEEVYRDGKRIKPNRVIFIHHPDLKRRKRMPLPYEIAETAVKV